MCNLCPCVWRIPSERALAEDERHEHDVRAHSHGAEAKNHRRLGDAARVALEHLGGVRRDIAGRADAESQVGPYHRYDSA